jgi:hypothetical protein
VIIFNDQKKKKKIVDYHFIQSQENVIPNRLNCFDIVIHFYLR